MAEIFKFQKQEQEECCPRCELHEDFFNAIIQSDSEEQVHELVGALIDIVEKSAYKQAIVDELHNKMELLNQLDKADCPCENCDDSCEY